MHVAVTAVEVISVYYLTGKEFTGASVALATHGGGNRYARAAFNLLYIPKNNLPLNIEVPAGVTCEVKP